MDPDRQNNMDPTGSGSTSPVLGMKEASHEEQLIGFRQASAGKDL